MEVEAVEVVVAAEVAEAAEEVETEATAGTAAVVALTPAVLLSWSDTMVTATGSGVAMGRESGG